jgi:hypothetical protein
MKYLARILTALFALLLVGCGGTTTPDGAALAVGAPAPLFSLPSANGGTVSLADYQGKKPVLLYFSMTAG